MTFGTSLKLAFLAVAVFALLAGCGSGDGGGMSATLGANGCAYEGDPTPAGSPFTVEVENRTSKFGAFALARITGGASVEELPAFLEDATRRFAQTVSSPTHRRTTRRSSASALGPARGAGCPPTFPREPTP